MNSLSAVRAVGLGLLIGLLLTQSGLSLMRVEGRSMEPALSGGELVVVLRPPLLAVASALGMKGLAQDARGAVVVLPEPRSEGILLGLGRPMIVKRVVARAGEAVSFERGQLIVEGDAVAEGWLNPEFRGAYSMPARRVPEGHLFLVGDNRLPLASSDSRQFGPVPEAALRGRAVARLRLPWAGGELRWPLAPLL